MTSDNRELFKKALIEALYSKYEDEIKESESESTVCTPAHYNNLRKLGIKVKEQRIGRISKKSFVAILVAAALLLVGCTAYVYRDKVRNFIETIYEKYIHVTYNDDENLLGSELSEAYVLTYIPDGYELIEESKTPIRRGLRHSLSWLLIRTEHHLQLGKNCGGRAFREISRQ